MFANSGIDASVYIVVALMLIAMVAYFMLGYKATKVDPSDALRHE
jgi:hypothetical protein